MVLFAKKKNENRLNAIQKSIVFNFPLYFGFHVNQPNIFWMHTWSVCACLCLRKIQREKGITNTTQTSIADVKKIIHQASARFVNDVKET